MSNAESFRAGIKTYFFGMTIYTEDQLRHPALWNEEMSNTWTLHWESPTTGLTKP